MGGRARPYTAYGGVAANLAPRNIKSLVRDQYVKTTAEQNGKLENILDHMNVLPRGNYPVSMLLDQNNADLISEKFGPQ